MIRLIVEADGGSRGNPGPAGYGSVVKNALTGEILAEVSEALGKTTNNVAEYSGLIAGLKAAARLAPGADTEVRMDSKLVVEQMSGRWQIKHPGLRPLAAQARQAAANLGRVTYTWIPRARNAHADRLANEAMDAAAGNRGRRPRAGAKTAAARNDAGGDDPDGAGAAALGVPGRTVGLAPGWTPQTGPATAVILLRHGETPLSPHRRFAGRADIPLTEAGERQAAAAAARLAARGGIDAIITSPLRRARSTAAAVSAATGITAEHDEAWAETDFGEWEGLSFAEASHHWPDHVAAWASDPAVAPPGGESIAAASQRVLPALGRLVAKYRGGCLVVVSHVTPMKIVLRHALGAPPSAARRMFLDVACLCETDWFADGAALIRTLNDTAHLMPRSSLVSAYAEASGG